MLMCIKMVTLSTYLATVHGDSLLRHFYKASSALHFLLSLQLCFSQLSQLTLSHR